MRHGRAAWESPRGVWGVPWRWGWGLHHVGALRCWGTWRAARASLLLSVGWYVDGQSDGKREHGLGWHLATRRTRTRRGRAPAGGQCPPPSLWAHVAPAHTGRPCGGARAASATLRQLRSVPPRFCVIRAALRCSSHCAGVAVRPAVEALDGGTPQPWELRPTFPMTGVWGGQANRRLGRPTHRAAATLLSTACVLVCVRAPA